MIQQEIFTRGNKQFTANYGKDADGNLQMWVDETELHGGTGQPVRHIPESIEINFSIGPGLNGPLKSIKTTWRQHLIGNTGNILPGEGAPQYNRSNKTDRKEFETMFGAQFQQFMFNGLIRDIFGHNSQGLFVGGLRRPDTEIDTTKAPELNYQTHNADGTPIAP